jgi:hypothetical protein
MGMVIIIIYDPGSPGNQIGLVRLGGLRAPALPLRVGTMRDRETIDAELRLVAALRRAATERGGPLRSIDVADALLDERLGGRMQER